MERTKGLKEYIQTKEYRESLGLSGQVTETYTMLAQGEYNRNYTFTHPITGQKLGAADQFWQPDAFKRPDPI